MKSKLTSVLGFALAAALCSPLILNAGTQVNTSCGAASTACETACCEDLQTAALAQPSKAGELLSALVAQHPEQLEAATVAIVSAFSQKLPADKLGLALHGLMKDATALLSNGIPAPQASAQADSQAALEQNLRLAGAVQELTRQAVAAVRENLSAPAQAIAPEADGSYPGGSIMIDPQAYASLMRGSMEQVVRGSLEGLGARSASIPEAYLPSVASLQQESGSYSYALNETPMAEKLPTAIAAPVEGQSSEATK